MSAVEFINEILTKIADLFGIEYGVFISLVLCILGLPIVIFLIRFIFDIISPIFKYSKESASISSEDYSDSSEGPISTSSNELVRHSNECEVVDMEEREYTTKLPKYNRK